MAFESFRSAPGMVDISSAFLAVVQLGNRREFTDI
jgi:hypothetical protein